MRNLCTNTMSAIVNYLGNVNNSQFTNLKSLIPVICWYPRFKIDNLNKYCQLFEKYFMDGCHIFILS